MYNLLVGFPEGMAHGSRVFEYADGAAENFAKPGGSIDLHRLMSLPALVMPEIGSEAHQVARIGRLDRLQRSGADFRFAFMPDPGVPEFSVHRIQAAAVSLGISDFEFHRTHWAVKDGDLHRTLWEIAAGFRPSPRVFELPIEIPREPDLVAVMMPFDAGYDPVYQALQEASKEAGFRCQRADDIWVHDHIMDDVISLIWRAQAVISDLTGKNANVFYETGIAHTIGRDVILTSQSMGDVPFDLRSIRTLKYLANREGLDQLKAQVRARLEDLALRG